MATSGGGAFLQAIKAKTAAAARRPSKEPVPAQPKPRRPSKEENTPAGSSRPVPRKKSSFVEMTQNAVRKASIVRVFNRKTLNDTSITSEEAFLAPPTSPILPGGGARVPKTTIPASPIPITLSQHQSPPLPVGSKSSKPSTTASQPELFTQNRPSIKSSTATITAQSSPALLAAKSSAGMSLASGDRRVSRLALSDDDFPSLRERSASITSVESVYGRSGNGPENFEMQNPLLGGAAVSKNTHQHEMSHEEEDAVREKRRSLYVSAGSHLDQSKLLSRQNTRAGGGRLSVSMQPPPRDAFSSEGRSPPTEGMDYSREAFSNPEFEVPRSPIPPPRKAKAGDKQQQQSIAPVRKATAEAIRRESSTASVGSVSPGPSRLRQNRANSKLFHDKANYSNNVLSNVQGAAEQALIKLRKQELSAFLQSSVAKHLCVKADPATKAAFLLERYKAEDLSQPLFHLCGKLPKGWETFLEVEQRVKYRQMNPGDRTEHDDDRLGQNMKDLLGDGAFTATDQLSRFRKLHQMQQSS